MLNVIKAIYNNESKSSMAYKLRRKRLSLFIDLLSKLKRPLLILDVGGTDNYWKNFDFIDLNSIRIVLLNLTKPAFSPKGFEFVSGDVRDMSRFRDNEFDIVHSNSVIEHLGGFEDQMRAAKEIRRVGKRYFIQTPNYYFPIEPHFVFPFFQFLPLSVRTFLLMHFNLGWIKKAENVKSAKEIIGSIRLLKEGELKILFPDATIFKEKFLGFTKSFIMYKWR